MIILIERSNPKAAGRNSQNRLCPPFIETSRRLLQNTRRKAIAGRLKHRDRMKSGAIIHGISRHLTDL